MASNGRGLQVGLQILLSLIIVALAYLLFRSITDPWEAVKLEKEQTEQTRARMSDIRTALIRYENVNERYTADLDSLVMFVKSDNLLSSKSDSIFGAGFNADDLPISPRTGSRFLLSVNDTSRVATYLLEDPDSDDFIGTLSGDVTQLNASSWE